MSAESSVKEAALSPLVSGRLRPFNSRRRGLNDAC
jgi:hypothetical protein